MATWLPLLSPAANIAPVTKRALMALLEGGSVVSSRWLRFLTVSLAVIAVGVVVLGHQWQICVPAALFERFRIAARKAQKKRRAFRARSWRPRCQASPTRPLSAS